MECNYVKLSLLPSEITKLLSVYISEDMLNTQMENIQDLSLLRTTLELKSCLIAENKHSLMCFPIQSILNKVSTSNVDEICLVLQLALTIQCDESQYIVLLNYITKNLTDNPEEEEDLKNTLKLLQVALSLCNSKTRDATFKEFIAKHNLNAIICKLLFASSKLLTNFLNVYILPKYLKIGSTQSSILQAIWKNAAESKNLDILCAIPEYFLSAKISLDGYPLVKYDDFWFLLQECLNNSNSNTHKQALYLLKEAIYSIETEESFTTEKRVVFWDFDCKTKIKLAWENIFMLFEIVREKQLHLIEPSYQLLSTLDILHVSWLICIYKILLTHSHSTVSAYAVLDILQSRWYQETNTFKIVIKCVLPAMNKTDIIYKSDIWNEFYQFSSKLDSRNFLILLQESATISWIPPICYQLYRSIFMHERPIVIPLDLTEKIINSTEKLPHKFIRNGCMELAVNFFKTVFLSREKFTFKDYIMSSWVLYKDTHLLYGKNLEMNNFKEYTCVIEKCIKTWHHSTNIDFKEVKVILKMLELPLFENPWLNEHILEPFMKKKFVSVVSDRIFILLCQKSMINSIILYDYIQEKLLNATSADEIIMKNVLPFLCTTDLSETELTDLFKKCTEILQDAESNVFQIHLAFEIINVTLIHNKYNASLNGINDILNFWKENLLKGNKVAMHCCLLFLHLYCNKEFKIYSYSIDYKENSTCIMSEKLLEIITIFEKIVETGNNDVIPTIFMQLKILLNLCDNLEIIFNFVDFCLKKLIELKRTDTFKGACKNFIESIFSNSKIYNNDKYVVEKTINITYTLLELAKSSDDVAHNLVIYLYNLSICNSNVAVLFIPIIVDLLLLGDILKKDQRGEYIICQQIDVDRKQVLHPDNPNFQRLSIRAQAIKFIQNILLSDSVTAKDRTKQADAVTLLLINKYNTYFNKRYFAHSHIHLQKLRILQALLVVHNHIGNQKQPLIDLLMNSLCMESHQISIKFFIQWLLIRLLYDKDRCFSIITSKMESTSKVHSSTIIAFVPILYHIALWRNEETFWIKLFEVMLPWTMGAHFNLRLYAQEGIKKLYEAACKRNFLEVQQKFKCSVDCVTEVLEKTERKIDLIDRYVFDAFDAKAQCNLQMIYFYIPKITNVTHDEYEDILNVAEFNLSDDCRMLNCETWITSSKPKSMKSVESLTSTNIIQKKVLPQTKSSLHDDNMEKASELIVVASLIDKIPNLAGLSRTCEVFGVTQLVLNTINVVKHHEFQSVSMSSENWINILEIKIDRLRCFLLDMKEKGYSVVGAEQTSDSVKLNVFQFPKKCILLLGNEKEGIPPNMLSLIDFCVEIAQFGVVRSLNVHVAAATFIWEYTKQHVLQ